MDYKPETLTLEKVRAFIDIEVDEFRLEDLRRKHGISSESASFYMSIKRLLEQNCIKKINRGIYRKVKIVKPVKVFGRERRPPINLKAPKDRETGEPLSFFNDIVYRGGDFIVISGFKNKGKTALCLNLTAENLDMYPALMGNEYTTLDNEPAPRLLNKLDDMDWVEWINENGEERFELLPVYEDYAEQIRSGRLNIIDWINLPGEYYMISPVTEGIKRANPTGITVGVLQKNPGTDYGRGGNLSKDFADVELLLDPFGDDSNMVLLTVGVVKEPKRAIMGHKFVYRIKDGVKIVDFREVVKCPKCYGKGWMKFGPCEECHKTGYVDKEMI